MPGKVAFVGTNGGGKSTIVQLLIRFYEPDAGRIAVNGEPLAHIRRDDWLKRVSIVFQEAYLRAEGRPGFGAGSHDKLLSQGNVYSQLVLAAD
ncbi:ATP-binding cassette domain-containing protein [Paenibacillus sp. N4]|uniref:ATP-binding cassette domain-containing protein n=1 Tax=Paenibacillus vietnamensis TaxID=2590547 RepID=UPI001CD056CB|nr:ATP-binding cassette domain-containing protein [Paenibacillus vietnamensis]MCA0755676.1 ATP-binding cassette domain-containing protein [Paenibacillus vietnamensis]